MMPDRKKVLKALEACTTKKTKCFASDDKLCPYFTVDIFYCERELMNDALALIKDHEAVMPNVSSVDQRCGNCNKVIEMDGWKACPWCGKPIDWESWWRKNANGVMYDGRTD